MQAAVRKVATFALAAVALASVVLFWFPWQVTHRLEPASFNPWGKNAYGAPIAGTLPKGWSAALLQVDPDSGQAPAGSRLALTENGAALGPPHSIHAEIAEKGGGRFSHWGEAVIFSSSDNSDPRSNGRAYAIGYEVAPPTWLVLLALLAAASTLTLPHRDGRRSLLASWASVSRYAYWIAGAIVALYLNVTLATLVEAPIPYPDSSGYLTWSLFRTVGYPFFLHTYHFVAGTWQYLHTYQLNLLIAGTLLLGYGVARVTRSYLAAWLVVALVVGWANALLSATDFLTEPPFAAFTMAHIGLVLLYLATSRRLFVWLAAIALAAAVAVKSVAVVLLGPVALVILFSARGRRAVLLPLMLVPLVSWLVPSAYNFARNGVFESSTAGGYALAGHVAWAIAPRPGSNHNAEAERIEQRLRPILAKRPEFNAPSHYVAYTANEYNTLLWANVVPELLAFYPEACPASQPSCTWKSCPSRCSFIVNRTLMQLSREAIAAEPKAFGQHVAAHFYGLWRDAFSGGTDFVQGAAMRGGYVASQYDQSNGYYRTMLAPVPPIAGEEARAATAKRIADSGAKRFIDLVTLQDLANGLGIAAYRAPWMLLALGLAASFLIFVFRRLGPAAAGLCYVALCANAYFLGTALAQPSLNRYAWPMQGVIAALVMLAAWSAFRWLEQRLQVRKLAREGASPAGPGR